MPHLRLRLLGAFEVELSSPSSAPLAVKKAQALLAYLALHPGQHESREKLAALLWADTAEAFARTNLRQTLALLRKALGHRECPCVLNAGTALYLDAERVEIDVIRFEQCCDQATPAALEEAVALYQGELLAGFTLDEEAFEDWLTSERRRLHERQRQALNALMAHYMETAQYARSIAIAVKLLALDPLQEAVHRTLMRAYHAEGRRRAVLRQYENCREILQRELGIKPEAETERLYRQLLSQPPAADAVSRALKKDTDQKSKPEFDSDAEPEISPDPAWTGQAWLEAQGLGHYADVFADNDIDFELLPEITDPDLQSLGISLGHRKKLLKAIAALAEASPADETSIEPSADAEVLASDTPESLPAEHRQVTVMQINLADSSVLAEWLDPEDLGELIRAFQACCIEIVNRYEGHPANYLSDGLLVYFGYPRAHEDDAERAVRAGLEIINAAGKLKLAFPSAPRLHTRIGIATGRVVVDETYRGAGQAIVGETPALAAQLQNLAEPDSLVVGASTQRLAGGVFEYHDLGAHTLKGFSKPVQAWRVAGLQAVESRFEAAHTMGMTPLVGREAERGLLWERWQQAKTGAGQVVFLSGEPGIGKSRMIQALREQIAAEACIRLNYQCSPYYANSALYPITHQLQRAAGFASDDTVERKLDRLESLLAQSYQPPPDAVPLIAALLSIPSDTRYPPLDLSPQRQKQKTLEALVDQLLGLAAQQAVLFVLEDAHWIDPTTQELLDLAIDRIQDAPVLMVLTFRPEFNPPWTRYTHVTALTLNRLSRQQVIALVKRLTGGKGLPGPVVDQVVAKTDGVPLFVEELTKMIVTADFLRDAGDRYELTGPLSDIAIPTTLQDSLMARLDRQPEVRQIAQLGAVLGREFSYEMLQTIASHEEPALRKNLNHLVEQELLYQRGHPPDARYIFKHALIQDMAYQSLLKRTRRQIHRQVAELLENRFPELAEREPELLAHHYSEAGLVEQAVSYWQRAGQLANERSASLEAMSHLTRGIDLLKMLPDTLPRDRQELPLQVLLATAAMLGKGFSTTDVESACRRAQVLCQRLDDTEHLIPALFGLWRYTSTQPDFSQARCYGEELLKLAEQRDEAPLYVMAHYAMGSVFLWMAELSAALDHLKKGIERYAAIQHHPLLFRFGHNLGVCCQSFRALALWTQGYPDRAISSALEAVALADELAHPATPINTYWFAFEVSRLRGEHRAARDYSKTLVSLSTEHGIAFQLAYGIIRQGWTEAVLCHREQGLEQMRQGFSRLQAMGSELNAPISHTLLAEAYGNFRRIEQGLDALNESLAIIERTDQYWYQAEVYRCKGELLLQQDKPAVNQAESCFQQALDIASQQQAKSLQLRAATSLARLWREQGKRQAAFDLLGPVYGWFTEGFDTADLKGAKALLEELS